MDKVPIDMHIQKELGEKRWIAQSLENENEVSGRHESETLFPEGPKRQAARLSQ